MRKMGIFCRVRMRKYNSYKGSVGKIAPNLAQTIDMLNKAFAKIPDNTNLILHSDQGWQYQHKHYQQMLADKGIRQSMSRKGNCKL